MADKNKSYTEANETPVGKIYGAENFSAIPVPTPQIQNDTIPQLDPRMATLLPLFLRKLFDNRQLDIFLGQATGENKLGGTIAHVPSGSTQILVDEPQNFAPYVLAHEATHTFQHTRQYPPDFREGDYDYGDLEGLQKARAGHKTIANYTSEQQAEMVGDYYRMHQAVIDVAKKQGGILTPEQSDFFERYKNAYEPFIKQLSQQPKYNPDVQMDYNEKWEPQYGYLPNSGIGTPPQAKDFPLPQTLPPPPVPPGRIVGFTDASPTMGGMPMRVQTANKIQAIRGKR